MLMKKFIGATSREAMRKMKADLGPEAYVISNRTTPAGVEILCMSGSAVDEMARQTKASADRPGLAKPSPVAPAKPAPLRTLRDIAIQIGVPGVANNVGTLRSTNATVPARSRPAERTAPPQEARAAQSGLPAPIVPSVSMELAASPRAAAVGASGTQTGPSENQASGLMAVAPNAGTPSQSATDSDLVDEIRAMKFMFETRLASLAWRDVAERRPLAMNLWRELTGAGFSPALARTVVSRLPDDYAETQARKWMQEVLAHNLHCVQGTQDLILQGGVYALVGPTGAGKTTTTAKLAARCVVTYGAASLGLITTDGYRIGAFDQLSIYGKILGVNVHAAQSAAELEAMLATLRGKRLILIDTSGMSQRDARVGEQIGLLAHPAVQRLLLLNASAQSETLDDVVQAYSGAAAGARPLAGTILTKLDEAVKLAPVLDTCARHMLRIHHVTNGQRVPEDLHPANARALIHRALRAPSNPVFDRQDDALPFRAAEVAPVRARGV